MSQVLAFDFGASGGRAILAKYDAASGSLKYEEIHRFENGPMDCGGKLCWDFPYLLAEIKKELKRLAKFAASRIPWLLIPGVLITALLTAQAKLWACLPITAIPAQKIMPDKAYEKISAGKDFMQPREIKLCP